MRQKLYANTKHYTKVFLGCIICVTLGILLARFVLLPNMATTPPPVITDIVEGDTPFPYSYNSRVYFATPTSEGNIMVENPEDSEYLISAEILDVRSSDSYLYTGFIEPGVTIERRRLQQSLGEGVHELALRLTAYDSDSLDQLYSIERSVTLYVGERPAG